MAPGSDAVEHPRSLRIDASFGRLLAEKPLDLGDLEAVRLVLRGNSVIDWNRVHFHTFEEVDRFLHLHLLDLSDPEDARRLVRVHQEAITYLHEHLGLNFPKSLHSPDDVRDVFLAASQTGGFRRQQIQACVILKLMHVINHMEAAELRFYTPRSEAELGTLAETRILESLSELKRQGFPLVDFYGSRKERHSIITKLLAKRETTAATIFDKLRFRIVTEKPEHVVPVIAWQVRNLFPLNYVIPGQSHNNLVRMDQLLRSADYAQYLDKLQGWSVEEDEFNPEENPFSGATYRMVNFIVDFPIRVDQAADPRFVERFGRVIYVLVEFQVMDEATARRNEEGENAHDLYKERQRAIVAARLRKGARWKGGGSRERRTLGRLDEPTAENGSE